MGVYMYTYTSIYKLCIHKSAFCRHVPMCTSVSSVFNSFLLSLFTYSIFLSYVKQLPHNLAFHAYIFTSNLQQITSKKHNSIFKSIKMTVVTLYCVCSSLSKRRNHISVIFIDQHQIQFLYSI